MGRRKKTKEKTRWRQEMDKTLAETYGNWKAVEDIRRSFFVWKGGFSGSFKELEIANILKGENLRFFREVSFDLKKRFDFYIPLLDLVIEYDGGHHFIDQRAMKNDIEKENLLRRLGIKLIRYNRTHTLKTQILHDLIYRPVLNQ